MSTKSLTLAKLMEVYHWTPDSLEYKILREACGKPGQSDAQVVVRMAALDGYLKTTKQGRYISSATLFAAEQALSGLTAPKNDPTLPAKALRISKTTPAWKADADSNGDRAVTLDEMKAYYAEGADGTAAPSEAKNHSKVTDQQIALLKHQIAMISKDTDYLAARIPGKPTPGAGSVRPFSTTANEYQREYYTSIYDGFLRQPLLVSYKLTNADLLTRTKVVRKTVEEFFNDPNIPASAAQILDDDHSWYSVKYSPFKGADGKAQRDDRGHQWPYNDYASYRGAKATFGSINMSGQASVLNEGAWEKYESAVHASIYGIDGAEAYVYVANLYLAPDGKPQTEEGRFDASGTLIPGSKIVWYGPGKDRKPGEPGYGEERFAQATDCLKAWLVQLPNGKMTTMAVRMRNAWDLPRNMEPDSKNPSSVHQFIQDNIISVDEFERLSGYDVALPDGKKPKEEATLIGADALVPYLRDNLAAKDRAKIGLLFPIGAAMPEKLDPKKAPPGAVSSEEDSATPPPPPPVVPVGGSVPAVG